MVSPQDGPAGGYQASLVRSAMLSLMVRGTDKAAGPHARSSSSPTSGAETRDRVPATPSGHPLPRSRSTPRARGSLPGEGEHRRAPGRETKRSPRPEDASRGSHNLQKPRVPAEAAGFPTTPPKSPPRRDRGRRLSVSLSRRTEEELAGPPVSFPPPAHHPVTLWGVGGSPGPRGGRRSFSSKSRWRETAASSAASSAVGSPAGPPPSAARRSPALALYPIHPPGGA